MKRNVFAPIRTYLLGKRDINVILTLQTYLGSFVTLKTILEEAQTTEAYHYNY